MIPNSDIYIASISGGKDSTALWLYLKYELQLNIIPVFADTGWEHPDTYKYLDYLESKLGLLHRVKADKDFVELVKHSKRFPKSIARFCTRELKLNPLRDFINTLSLNNPGKTICSCSGIRAEESASRAAMDEYVEIDDFFKLPQWRPLHKWPWQEVFNIHKKYGIEPNPLYLKGLSRVGCMPCVMANLKDLREIAIRFPEVFDKVKEVEKIVQDAGCKEASFFHSGLIPERCCTRAWVNPKNNKPIKLPTPDDVKTYALMENFERHANAFSLFNEPQNEDLEMCSSIYGLCE